MEKKFYSDDFEHFLKDVTDNFRIYPSRKVWHSIYNDLHPSRKWPSLAVLLMLISSTIFIGISSKNEGSFFKDQNANLSSKTTAGIKLDQRAVDRNNRPVVSVDNAEEVAGKAIGRQEIIHNFDNKAINNTERLKRINSEIAIAISFATATTEDRNNEHKIPLDNNSTHADGVNIFSELSAIASHINSVNKAGNISDSNSLAINKKMSRAIRSMEKNVKNNSYLDREWIEDYSFHNKPFTKWKTKASYQFYVTPSIGYRKFSRNSNYNPVVASSSFVANTASTQSRTNPLTQIPAINMEIGGNMLYPISRKINLKAGLQLNYTNYNIDAYELKHPTLATLILTDPNTGLPVVETKATTLANVSGVSSRKLNNNTYQISIPLGADVKLAGNSQLKWFAGATIQPTYIVGGNSYFISSDLKNYVTDETLMRHWNLNGAIETFVSYKTKSGIILNAGPQFRYQLLSTYSRQYTYEENLYNIGLKIGITTKF